MGVPFRGGIMAGGESNCVLVCSVCLAGCLAGWLSEVVVRSLGDLFFYLKKRKSFTWLNTLRHIH